MKYFIASPWKNTDAVKDLTVALSDRGHTAYSFLDNGANRLSGAPALEESEEESPNAITDWENNPVVKQIFDFDIKVLKESDVVILLEPSGRSALAEAGIAFGMGKKIILVGLVEHPELVVYCICEKRYPSTEEFLKSVDNLVSK